MAGSGGKKKKKKSSSARAAKKAGSARKPPRKPPKYSTKVTTLAVNGLLTPSALSEDTLKAIDQLSDREIQALIRINETVPLSAFFSAPSIQWW